MSKRKSRLLKNSGDLIRECQLSKSISRRQMVLIQGKLDTRRQMVLIQGKLDRLDLWLKIFAVKIRCLADDVKKEGD